VSETFVSRFNGDRKLLAFTDSVQDASHRAGFFAARTFRFTMRTAIQSLLESESEDVPLEEFAPKLFDYWAHKETEERAAAMLIPPDLVEDQAYIEYFGLEKEEKRRLRHKPSKRQSRELQELLNERLSWEVTREYGLAVPFGRSLDSTACSTLTQGATSKARGRNNQIFTRGACNSFSWCQYRHHEG